MARTSHIFTSESVTEGHPDKICDQISDGILDALLIEDYKHYGADPFDFDAEVPEGVKNLRCACETFTTTGTVIVGGEVRCKGYVDIQSVVREVVNSIGYNRAKFGFDAVTCGVINMIHEQSADIAMGVDDSDFAHNEEDAYDKIGAGDQGSVFGYASNETKTYMPMTTYLAHAMSQKLTEVRKSGELDFLRPDGKTQVSVKYENEKPVAVDTVVLSTQHSDLIHIEDVRRQVLSHVIKPVLDEAGFELPSAEKIFINPTGRFVVGGPMGDTGLTGRKLIVDTYGGVARHGGGAFSGKDCTKVDRSGAYCARWAAKNVVAAGLADVCELEISYAIGVCRPVAVYVDCHGTAKVDEELIEKAVMEVFDFRPAAMIDALNLWRPIFRKTSNYGHFGRELPEFEWEKINKTEELKAACNVR